MSLDVEHCRFACCCCSKLHHCRIEDCFLAEALDFDQLKYQYACYLVQLVTLTLRYLWCYDNTSS